MISYIQTKGINTQKIEELLAESIATNTFTNSGPVKCKLEQKLSELFNLDITKKVVCTSSGTSALFIAVSLLESKIGKALDWVTPAFNFPSAIVNRLNTSVKDIELSSYSLATSCLKPHTGLILPTLFGTMPDLASLIKYCKDHSSYLILDNASSPMSFYEGKTINNYGDVCIGSLHHTKYLGFGEGGYLVIDSEDYPRANSLANFGFLNTRDYDKLATNGKMSDIAAAYILSHIESYDLAKHQEIQSLLVNKIDPIPNVKVFNYTNDVILGNLPLIFDRPISHLCFRDVGIEANKYYQPLISAENSNWLYERMINLPLHCSLTNYEISSILKRVEYEASRII
jgi:dTDP-4-amino-4,6-dideoxygalactose transaminase